MIALFLWACTTSGSTPPAPEPAIEPVVEEKAAPETPAGDSVMLVFGTQCEPFADGVPDSTDAVKAKLEAEGVTIVSISAMPTCKACNTCPKLAVEVVVAPGSAAEVQRVFPDHLAN